MGQYKVPQDVEAEDKIIGFLTLKQFIYAVIGVAWMALSFVMFKRVPVFFVVFGIPIGLLFLALGLFRRQDQPFEALFVALVSFWAKPRRRLWEKEPIAEVFTVEPAPPKVEPFTRNRAEVRGQLEKLVRVMESHEGAAMRPELQEPSEDHKIDASERIFMPEHLREGARPSDTVEVSSSDDVLDIEHNANAHNISQLIAGSVKQVREEAITKMHGARGIKGKPKETPPPSSSAMTGSAPDGILKKTLADSNLRVNQIAEKINNPIAGDGVMKEGQTVKVEPRQRMAE